MEPNKAVLFRRDHDAQTAAALDERAAVPAPFLASKESPAHILDGHGVYARLNGVVVSVDDTDMGSVEISARTRAFLPTPPTAMPAGTPARGLPVLGADPDEALACGSSPALALAPQRVTAARRLIDALIDAGVDTFFGIPGGPVSPIFDALVTAPRARLVESRHETGAVFAAVGYHRASGKIPAVVVTAGPGITNAVTGVASAHLEKIPMLIICGDVAWATGGRKLVQDSGPAGVGAERMLGHLTRVAIRVSRPACVVSQGMAALRAATTADNPGPALLVVPIDHARARVSPSRIDREVSRAHPAPPDPAAVEDACALLAAARRPLLVLGNGCRSHAAAIRRLVDAVDVPFVTTPAAKGVVSEEHPRSLRHGGLAASRWARAYTRVAPGADGATDGAEPGGSGVDVAVVLGTDLDDSAVGPTPYIGPGGRLIHVDLDPTVFHRNLPTYRGVVADVGAFADAMCRLVRERGLRNRHADSVLRAVRAQSPYDVAGFATDSADAIAPHRAIADLQAAAPDAVFTSDIGGHMLFALHYLTARGPHRFSIDLGLGSMGSGISAAIGLAMAEPRRPVVCVCGDGGMQMAGMEALVALQHRLPIVYAVFNDARYNLVYHGMKQLFGCEARWDTPWIDFAAWARALGISGVRIERPGQIAPALIDRLLAGGGPMVLDIRIDREVSLSSGRIDALHHMSMLSE